MRSMVTAAYRNLLPTFRSKSVRIWSRTHFGENLITFKQGQLNLSIYSYLNLLRINKGSLEMHAT